jgi:hypothetical protein
MSEKKPAHIDQLREHLMSTLAALRDRENPMDVDRARAVAQVATVLVDTARVEVDFMKVTHRDESDFLGKAVEGPSGAESKPLPHWPHGGRVHKLQG